MKKFFQIIFGILGTLIGFSIFCTAVGSVFSTEESPTIAKVESTIENDFAQDTIEQNQNNQCNVGDTAITKRYNLTVESCNEINSDNMFIVPDEGKEFVEVVLLIENTSNDVLNVSSLLQFNAYVDGYSIEEDFLAHSSSDYSTMNGEIAPGKKLEGSLCYQVPCNWSELEIQVGILSYAKKDLIVLLENK